VQIHLESWRESFMQFYPEMVRARGDLRASRRALWQRLLADDTQHVFVALDANNQIVGFVQGGAAKHVVEGYDGELHRLYIAPSAQGQGIGRTLIVHLVRKMQQAGFRSMLVAAWSVNHPARSVYEHLGAQFIREIQQEHHGLDASQSLYGWRDSRVLFDTRHG